MSFHYVYSLEKSDVLDHLSQITGGHILKSSSGDRLFFENNILKFSNFFMESRGLSPLWIDFEKLYFDLVPQKGKKDPLRSLFRLKDKETSTILDATCGTGKDSVHFVWLGHCVYACENHPVIFSLLYDALRRVLEHPFLGEIFARNYSLFYMNAVSASQMDWFHKIDIIYFDPMYETPKKKALSRKEMEVFHHLLGGPVDNKLNFNKLRGSFEGKIIVKRGIKDEELEAGYNYQKLGKTTRYDVYI